MTRDEYIEIRKREINKTLNGEDIAKVLHAKCIEGGATSEHNDVIKYCIIQLLQNSHWDVYFRIAKSYFDVKFNIMEMWSTEHTVDTPLGPQKTRELITVY